MTQIIPSNIKVFIQKIIFCISGVLSLSVLLLMPAFAPAQPMEPYAVAQKLQETYDKTPNLVADFKQKTSVKFSGRVRQGSGSMIFLKPGHMRWDYFTPDRQVIISDGEIISMYFEKNSQMIISNAKDYLQSDVTYSFFAGTGNILQDFEIDRPDFDNFNEETHLIKLIPKAAHPHVSFIHAWVTDATFLLEHLQIVDHFDTVTDLYFNNVKIDSDKYGNRNITQDIFSFSPPPQTEIIKQY
ncbi:MAG: outer membrane lipoprotein carrier protein LolA [Deltaproteobacteria bacterium]|jgi:outer membrane lipoprotein carrier protein|nr:outer membrane lipoprotein carrier protein LolA [Deltaproteobacteria bacterium]